MAIKRIIVSISFLLPLVAFANPPQTTPSALPEGARVVAGDLSKNEFYILGKNETAPAAPTPTQQVAIVNKQQQPEGSIVTSPKVVAVTKSPVIPITHVAKTKPLLAKKMLHEKIIPLISQEKILASFEPVIKKKKLVTKSNFKPVIKEYREILLSEKNNVKPSKKIVVTAAIKPKTLEHPLPTKALLKVIKVVPLRPATNNFAKLNVHEEAKYIMYKGEKRKIISFVPDTKTVTTPTPVRKQIALTPTPDDARS